ncbi:hypothetical protein RO3G_03141 [Rhizopus delemar RA 99-880]|uniref:Uncharacterized protein n=1 Tax=Rhizopus delemar (strain RA 99-880 / ATCC MYA-4621 / FGSC 9543 / NRRL 43880) TaxID=246409 RepID=I1BQF7_RHIO9|nr:hypothetical protein RO3G_03141 [Rhizopus delemar RA 99-880]|eukprot:EIE78437.1 hypothetical protein RO3G_03141 [Rhizopus delemar RA 99-880]
MVKQTSFVINPINYRNNFYPATGIIFNNHSDEMDIEDKTVKDDCVDILIDLLLFLTTEIKTMSIMVLVRFVSLLRFILPFLSSLFDSNLWSMLWLSKEGGFECLHDGLSFGTTKFSKVQPLTKSDAEKVERLSLSAYLENQQSTDSVTKSFKKPQAISFFNSGCL